MSCLDFNWDITQQGHLLNLSKHWCCQHQQCAAFSLTSTPQPFQHGKTFLEPKAPPGIASGFCEVHKPPNYDKVTTLWESRFFWLNNFLVLAWIKRARIEFAALGCLLANLLALFRSFSAAWQSSSNQGLAFLFGNGRGLRDIICCYIK